jgi:hypothetical protein
MAVVINEFEVVAERPAATPPNPVAKPPENPPPAPTLHDIARIIQRQMERQARLWAH